MAGRGRTRWFWLAAAVVVADQTTKLAMEKFTGHDFTRVIIPGLLNLVHTRNPGVAFGLFADAESKWVTALMILFSAAIMGALAWLLATDRAGNLRSQTGLALILGGAAGNGIDRLLHDGVMDFIDFYLGTHHWPAFNLADSTIVIGAGLVILELLVERQHQEGARG